jgi:hypothetical protein
MRLLFKRLLSYFPSKLPVGMTELHKFSDDIIELSGAYADIDSMKYAISTMIIHADSKFGALAKNYFVVRLRKVAANQVASQLFTDIKTKQQEAQKAAEQAIKQAEVTANSVVTNVEEKT